MTTLPKPRVWMLGAGGAGMAPLAILFRQSGYDVFAADADWRDDVRGLLQRHGILVVDATLPEWQPGDRLIISAAVDETHPWLVSAGQAKIQPEFRGRALARLLADRRLLAVVGSHGKTSTTARIAHAVREARLPTGYAIGGLPSHPETFPPARWTNTTEDFVAEIDESDGTLEAFHPAVTVALNLDFDHGHTWESLEDLEAAFGRLFARTSEAILYPVADPRLEALVAQSGSTARAIPFASDADLSNREAVQRALTAFGYEISSAEETFSGVQRRSECWYQNPSFQVWHDYAHHPAEIAAFLDSLQSAPQPITLVFEPHRYSRTRDLRGGIARACRKADHTYLLPIYAASESPVSGGSDSDLQTAFREAETEFTAIGPEDLDTELGGLQSGTLAFVGAGQIDQWGSAWLDRHGLGSKKADSLVTALRHNGFQGEVRSDLDWSRVTTLGVGGRIRLVAYPQDEADLTRLIDSLRSEGVAWQMIGRGSNLIAPDDGWDGVGIQLRGPSWSQIVAEGDFLTVGAGCRLKQLCGYAVREGLPGFEGLEGIPGTVGGSLRMNAGAMGQWIFDLVSKIKLLTFEGNVYERSRSAFHPTYRQCPELDQAIALSATFAVSAREEPSAIQERMDQFRDRRRASQPIDPSAGCLFKNPEGDYAGRLLEVSSLKGSRVGSAVISNLHGNFLVNEGGASEADVLALARYVRGEVERLHGTRLEPEALRIRDDWEAVFASSPEAEVTS